MARLDDKAIERGARLFDRSDEQLGRWLADTYGRSLERAIERAICSRLGVESLVAGDNESASAGSNALMQPPRISIARLVLKDVTDHYLDDAIKFDREAPFALAIWLALQGDYERAGRAMRKSTAATTLVEQVNRRVGEAKMRVSKLDKKIERLTLWHEIGFRIRSAERGVRMSDSALAREIQNRTGDPANNPWHSIRVELPKLGLDAASWPNTVKPRARRKTNRIFKSRATLRR